MLEPQARTSLLRRGLIAALALAAAGVRHGVAFVEHDDAIEIRAEPVDDLLHARRFLGALVGAQRGVGREQNALAEPDRRSLAKTRERRYQKPFHAERRPVALGVLDQRVGFRDPDGAASALEPIVEEDARDLPALAGAGAVAEEPAAAEADGVRRVVGCGRDDVEGRIDRPGAGEMAAMRLAGIDHAFKLGVGEEALANDTRGKMRAIGRLGRRDRGHGRRLHETGRMRAGARYPDRLKRMGFIERVGDAALRLPSPVGGLIGEFDDGGFAGRA